MIRRAHRVANETHAPQRAVALAATAAVRDSARPGSPLPQEVRSLFEPRFGHDFSRVRVHADGRAADAARAVGTRAYTFGRDIVFGSGEYAPGTMEGRRVLAHELGHVVEQADGQHRGVQCFTEPAHKMIGDVALHEASALELLTLGPGLQVTFGDAMAMADYFESFEQMRRLAEKPGTGPGTQGEVRYVLWVRIGGNQASKKLDVWYDKYAVHVRDQAERGQRGRNIAHFPNPQSGDLARVPLQKNQRRIKGQQPFGALASYRQAHEYAMELAYEHGDKQEAMEDALLADAFACHYLTDSFSASHARVPRASIKEYWDKMVPRFHNKLIQWLADRIENEYGLATRGIVRGASVIPVVNSVTGVVAGFPNSGIRTAAVEKLSIALSPTDSLSFGNLVSLVMHDVEGAGTVEATIGGKPIQLVGDKDLVTEKKTATGRHKVTAAGRATFDAAVEAVKASIDDLWAAHGAGWHGENLSAAMQRLKGPDLLYTAEQLVPQAVDPSLLPPGQQPMDWQQKSVDDFLAQNGQGLVQWGKIAGPEFEKTLAEMTDLAKEARTAIERSLIKPLRSGNADEIRTVLRSIIAR